ncbi:hypothetical protein ACLOJK_030581 [Asimina triloba]
MELVDACAVQDAVIAEAADMRWLSKKTGVLHGELDTTRVTVQQAKKEPKLAIVLLVAAPQVDETLVLRVQRKLVEVVIMVAPTVEGWDNVLVKAKRVLEETRTTRGVETATVKRVTTLQDKLSVARVEQARLEGRLHTLKKKAILELKVVEAKATTFQRKVVELEIELYWASKAKAWGSMGMLFLEED